MLPFPHHKTSTRPTQTDRPNQAPTKSILQTRDQKITKKKRRTPFNNKMINMKELIRNQGKKKMDSSSRTHSSSSMLSKGEVLAERMKRMDPHQIIAVLEMHASRDAACAFDCLQSLKNSEHVPATRRRRSKKSSKSKNASKQNPHSEH